MVYCMAAVLYGEVTLFQETRCGISLILDYSAQGALVPWENFRRAEANIPTTRTIIPRNSTFLATISLDQMHPAHFEQGLILKYKYICM